MKTFLRWAIVLGWLATLPACTTVADPGADAATGRGSSMPVDAPDFRARLIERMQVTIATDVRTHEACPPGTRPCRRALSANPATALRGSAPFMAEIVPPEVFDEPGVGPMAADDWRNRHYCGGTLIAQGWVLTAAHCVSEWQVEQGFRVRLGMSNLATGDGQAFTMDRGICFEPAYCRAGRPAVLYRDDIALVHFVAPPDAFVEAPDPSYFVDRGVDVALVDNGALATWAQDGTARRWDMASGAETARIEGSEASAPPFSVPMPEIGRPGGNLSDFANDRVLLDRGARRIAWHPIVDPDPAIGYRGLRLEVEARRPDGDVTRSTFDMPTFDTLQLAPGTAYFVTAGVDGATLSARDAQTGRELWSRTMALTLEDTDYYWHQGGAAFAMPYDDATVVGSGDVAEILDPASGAVRASFAHPRSPSWQSTRGGPPDSGARNLVFGAGFDDTATKLITVTRRYGESDVWLWDIASGTLLQRFAQPDPIISEYALGARLLAGGTRLLTWTQYGTFRVWDVASGRQIASFSQQLDHAQIMPIRGDSALVVSDGAGASVWDLATGRELARVDHLNSLYGAEVAPGEASLLTWSEDATARLWSLADGSETVRIYHDGRVNGARFVDQGSRVLSWSEDGTARLTTAAGGRMAMRFDVAMNPPGSPLALPLADRPSERAAVDYLPVAGSRFALAPQSMVTIYGWGMTQPVQGYEPYASLMAVELDVMDNAACGRIEGMESSRRVRRVHPGVFCGIDEIQKTCKGDSGGPVIQDGVLVGVVSWGKITCAGTGEPGVYTRVSAYADWIRATVGPNPELQVLDAPPPAAAEPLPPG